MKGIVVSATSDIATEMCKRWNQKGWSICGTYLSQKENYQELLQSGIDLVFCDMSSAQSVDLAAEELVGTCPQWDFILFATGSQVPVGRFDQVNIDQWSSSLEVDYIHQLRLLHRLLPARSPFGEKSILFFAGGGTNNAPVNYSAYTLSKIGLIKACELLDAEMSDVKFSIIGPGWVKTKIHQATLEAGEEFAGDNFARTCQKVRSDECVSVERVIDSFEWVLAQPKAIVGGRNFSTVFDQWGHPDLVQMLSVDPNMYKLRRSGNELLKR